MWRFKFSAWAVVLLMTALSFGACDNDDDDTFVPPSNITEALKQVYPAAQNIEWEMKGAYYVADCWVSNDELEVWFDANANWVKSGNTWYYQRPDGNRLTNSWKRINGSWYYFGADGKY